MGRNRSHSRFQLGSRYWDNLVPRWDKEIFNTLANDKNGVVVAELKKAAKNSATVADFGCGVGTYLPTLGQLFQQVYGFDQSAACVTLAAKKMRNNSHVSVRVARTAPPKFHGFFDVVLCVNAAIHPRRKRWKNVFSSIYSLLRERGQLIVVVPSLESEGLIAEAEENNKRCNDNGNASHRPFAKIRKSIISIDGVPTRHYTRQELVGVLKEFGLKVSRLKRVEYSWRSHDIVPPRILRSARPWDWLAVARKSKKK